MATSLRPFTTTLRTLAALAPFALAATIACGDDPTGSDGGPAALRAVSGGGSTAEVATDVTLTVEVVDGDGDGVSGIAVDWSADDGAISPSRTSTDEAGRTSATWTLGETAGEQVATATVDGLDPVEFTATAEAGSLAALEADADSIVFVAIEETAQLSAAGEDAYGNEVAELELAWASTDTAVAAVDASGLVSARAVGQAMVVADGGSAADTVPVRVTQEASSIAVSPSADTLVAIDEEAALEAAVRDANGHEIETTNVAWTSVDDGVATVDEAGVVAAIGNGEAGIVASIGALADTALVRVRQEVAALTVTPAADTLVMDDTLALAASPVDANGYPVQRTYDVVWTSSDTIIAAVDGDGRLAGVGVGPVMATANVEGESAVAELLVAPDPARAVAVGFNTVCALDIDGRAYCWGQNGVGQVGDGTTVDRYAAIAVAGDHVFEALAAGADHVCGLTSPGDLYCWGYNADGQLGVGVIDADPHPLPGPVAGGHRFTAVDATWYHTCAITEADEAYCWGRNDDDQLGDGSGADQPAPVAVDGGLAFADIVVGEYHSCGRTDAGTVYCWGGNPDGQFGDGTQTPSPTPVTAAGGMTFASLSADWSHTCGVTDAGEGYCWGHNGSGRLGDGTLDDRLSPAAVSGGLTFARIEAGNGFTCGVAADGTAYCWGRGSAGDLGDGTFFSNLEPTSIASASSFAHAAAGGNNGCGLAVAGELYCWGYSIGVMSPDHVAAPASASGLTASSVALTGAHSCALTSTGAAYCWGSNWWGQVGDGTTDPSAVPLAAASAHAFDALAPAWFHTCGIATDGSVYCWGNDDLGQLGQGPGTAGGQSTTPVEVAGGRTYTDIGSGLGHSCALEDTGLAFCWGLNNVGQTGDTLALDINDDPIQASDTAFATLAVGNRHTCGLTADGRAYCWGDNFSGQLGGVSSDDCNGTPCARRAIPVDGGLTFDTLSAGGHHTCGLTTGGDLYCWGANFAGQLGTGDFTDQSSPTLISTPTAFVRIAAAGFHTCAIGTDGSAYCWGDNANGQLGDGTRLTRTTPTAVSGGHAFASIEGSDGHTCAATTGSEVYCWGFENYGQLGAGEMAYIPDPARVAAGLVFSTSTAAMIMADGAGPAWSPSSTSTLSGSSAVRPGDLCVSGAADCGDDPLDGSRSGGEPPRRR